MSVPVKVRGRNTISATISSWASTPYGPFARISPHGPTASEQPMHFRPAQGPPVIQPTLLTPTTGISYRLARLR